jgi:hypothetical protein
MTLRSDDLTPSFGYVIGHFFSRRPNQRITRLSNSSSAQVRERCIPGRPYSFVAVDEQILDSPAIMSSSPFRRSLLGDF